MMATCLQNSREPSHAPLQIDFVHVDGQYRVGKLLGSGGSGEPDSDSSSTLHWYLYMEHLRRERYQDGSWGCFEDRECRPVTWAQSRIQHIYKYCWQRGYLVSALVWQRRPVWGHCLGASWWLTWWSDQQETVWPWGGILICVTNGMFFRYIKMTLLNTLMHSSQWLHHYMTDTTSIMTSNQVSSRSKSMMFTLSYFSSTLVWHGNSTIPWLIYTPHTLWNIQLLVLFHSHPSMASKDVPNCIMTT